MINRRQSGQHSRHGFTMIEIILVVVILGMLTAVLVPTINKRFQRAKINLTKVTMNTLKMKLVEFNGNADRYPTTSEGLNALLNKPSDLSDDEWPDKYVDEIPKDAWNREFKYVHPSEHGKDYDIMSGGPDRKLGTADDITNFSEAGKTSQGL